MLSAIKDMATAIAIATVFAFSNGEQKWIWSQIYELRYEVLKIARQDWGCPSIFSKSACDAAPLER